MVNLKTKFIGLELKSPIIAGSCGLTSEVSKIEEIALSGAGAIVSGISLAQTYFSRA